MKLLVQNPFNTSLLKRFKIVCNSFLSWAPDRTAMLKKAADNSEIESTSFRGVINKVTGTPKQIELI